MWLQKDSFDDEHILVVGVDKSGGYGAIVIDLDTKQVIQHHVHSDQPVYNTVQNGEAVLKCLITKSYIITLAPAIICIWDKTTTDVETDEEFTAEEECTTIFKST